MQACRIPLVVKVGNPPAAALVDDEDFARLGHHRWRLATNGYVQRFVQGIGRGHGPGVRGPGHYVTLHREIAGLQKGDGKAVDHINRDKLDNRRENLRVGTQALNAQNKRGYGGSSHRGVSYDRVRGKWRAYAKPPGEPCKHLGRYATEAEAAAVASEFRREHMPWAVEG